MHSQANQASQVGVINDAYADRLLQELMQPAPQCNERCFDASKRSKCTCRCGGKFHAKGNPF